MSVCMCCFKVWPERQDILVRLVPKYNHVMDLVFIQHITLLKLSFVVPLA